MSQRYIKSQKRETRRVMRSYLREFTDYFKPKPKWWPWWVWEWMQHKLLHMEMILPEEKRGIIKQSENYK